MEVFDLTVKKIFVVLGISALLLTFSAAAFAAGGPGQGRGQGQGQGKGAQVTDLARGGMGQGLGRTAGSMSATVAGFLGISQEELVAARQSGKSLVQVAADYGKTEQELIDLIMKERTAQLDQLVSNGKLTRDQAGLHKTTMADRIKANINRTTVGPAGMGANNGFSGGKGFGKGTGVCPYLNAPAQ